MQRITFEPCATLLRPSQSTHFTLRFPNLVTEPYLPSTEHPPTTFTAEIWNKGHLTQRTTVVVGARHLSSILCKMAFLARLRGGREPKAGMVDFD